MHIFFFSSMLSGAKLGIGQWVWGWRWGRGRGLTGFERAPGIKKSLQIIPNKNILLVISTKLDIQVKKTNPNKNKLYAFAGPGNHTSSLVQVKTRSDTQQTDKVHIPD